MPYCCMHISYIQEYGIPGGRNDVYSVSIYTVKNMTVISLDSITYLLTYSNWPVVL